MAVDTATKKSWVQKTPNVCGGDACIRNTRITVHGLVHYRHLGLPDQRILEVIQGLTPDDLAAAWDYYASHPAEIEEAIRLIPRAGRIDTFRAPAAPILKLRIPEHQRCGNKSAQGNALGRRENDSQSPERAKQDSCRRLVLPFQGDGTANITGTQGVALG